MISAVSKPSRSGQSDARSFVRLPLSAIRFDLVKHVDLYCLPPNKRSPVLYRSGKFPISPRDIEELQRRGHEYLFVTSASFATVEKEMFNSLEDLVARDDVPPVDRFSLLQMAVSMELDMAFRLIRTNRMVSLSQRVAGNISKILADSDVLPRGLFNVVQHDFYTFTHVTNVAGFTLLLADRLGITNEDERQAIAEGALLHDIGKRFIPTDVLCKRGSLTDKERELIETHPLRGFIDLRTNSELQFEQLLMVYQHHERVDGKGYPVRLTQAEIHPWARMLAVVDVFDAITSERPYRKPMPLIRALEFLEQRSGTHFDEEMVRCWTSAMREK